MTDELTQMLMAGRQTRACVMCGATFSRRSTGRDAGRACSRKCGWILQAKEAGERRLIFDEIRIYRRWAAMAKQRAKLRPCMACGVRCRGLICGAKRCAAAYARTKGAEAKGVKQYRCKRCGGPFSSAYGDKRRAFCSKKCGRRFTIAKSGKRYRTRARYHGVTYEKVDRLMVFERDRWRCQVCGRKAPRRLMGTIDAKAPELDHRIPMAMGGGHTYLNCQLACRRCNNAKGGTIIIGQQPLFTTLPGGV